MSDTDKLKNKNVPETMSPRMAVEFAVEMEKVGASFYERLARKFGLDSDVGEIFEMLARDETDHQNQFERLLNLFGELPAGAVSIDQLGTFRTMADFFIGDAGLYREIDKIKTREEAFDRALALEQRTLGYYEMLEDIFGENDALRGLIEAEQGHVLKVAEYLMTGAKMRGLGDVYPGGPSEQTV
jgi:rubrerythrin